MPVGNSLGMYYEDDLEKELDHIERGPYVMPDDVIDARSMDQDIDGIAEGEKSVRSENEFSNGIQNSVGRVMNPRFASGTPVFDPQDVMAARLTNSVDDLPEEYRPKLPEIPKQVLSSKDFKELDKLLMNTEKPVEKR